MRALTNIAVLSYFTYKEGLRNRILKAILILSLVFSAANIFFAELFSWDLGKVSIDFGLATVAITGLLLVFSLGVKAIADDLERHSIYLILSRPIAGWQYIVGKYLGLGFLLLIITCILGAATAFSAQYIIWRYPAYVSPNFSWAIFLYALFFQWLSLMIVLAITFFWFSFARQTFVAILLSVSSYLVGQNMELLRRVTLSGSAAEEAPLHKSVIIFISWLFPNLSYFDLKISAAYGLAVPFSKFIVTTGYGIAYVGLLLSISTIFFNRRELV